MKAISNKRALFEYYVIQKLEAGIALTGSEIKSIRAGRINFKDSYAKISEGECFLMNFHISPWEKA
ncbi:MAG TPA: SsrA-binding protein, partial [Methanothrix sp.]|nr:SsrA-binding protein [Methanothrix sp.]